MSENESVSLSTHLRLRGVALWMGSGLHLRLQLGLHACNSVIVTVGLHLPYPYTRRRATTRPAQFLLLCARMGHRGLTTAHH